MPPLTQRVQTEGGVQAVALTIQLIEAMAMAQGQCGITELAESIGTSKARVFRHLRTLSKLGYATHDADSGRYKIGSRLAELSVAIADQFDLLPVAQPAMQTVARLSGLTVILSRVEDDIVYPIGQMESVSPITIRLRLGVRMGLHNSAQGKLLLAFGAPGVLDRVVSAPLEAVTRRTIVSPEKLKREIRLIRARGWAAAPDETTIGLNALAVPVLARDGHLIGTLALLATVTEIPSPPLPRHLSALIGAAKAITAALPARPRTAPSAR